jgi:capsular exopolysaccharide synthesis family protein
MINQPPDPNGYNTYPKMTDNDDVDITHYIGLFMSNWYWFVAALFCAVVIAYGINHYTERIYSVSASLLIKDDANGGGMTSLDRIIPGGDAFGSQQNLQNEIGILKSFSLNYRVMQKLPEFQVTTELLGRRGIARNRIYQSSPFIVRFDSIEKQLTDVPVSIKILPDDTYSIEIAGTDSGEKTYTFGERINIAGFDFALVKRSPGIRMFDERISNNYNITFTRPEVLANLYRSKLNIAPLDENASLVNISISGASPLQESVYLNKLMEEYIQQGLDFKNQTVEKTIEFIDQQLGLIADSLSIAENKLENFRLTNRLIDLSSEGIAIKTKLEDYTKEKINVGLQKQYYDYLSEYLKSRNESGEIVSPTVMGVADQRLIQLVMELAELQLQKKQLKYNFSANQPAINLIDSKIEDARAALEENVRNSVLNTERELRDIGNRIHAVEGELNRLPGTERKLINIQRKFDLNNTVYTYMLEKRSEAGIAKASNVSGNRIIDHAEPFNSSLISPKQKKNYLLSFLIGLLLPGAYIFIVDLLQNKILDKKDIEKKTNVPIIGVVGHNTSGDDIPVITKPGSALAESFRNIRTNLKYYLNGEKNIVIAVTSTISGEGKTFISLNLASVIAMLGKKTLVVGLDMRRPRLDRILESGNVGLSSFLIGDCGFSEIVNKTGSPNLYFVSSGPVPPNPSELIESVKMKEFMSRAKEEFEYIILDTPPMGIVSDALLIKSYSDINIFVIRQGFSYKSTLELIQSAFEKKEFKNLSIAVNDVHVSGYFGYGLRYGYGSYNGYEYNYGSVHHYNKSNYNKYYSEN